MVKAKVGSSHILTWTAWAQFPPSPTYNTYLLCSAISGLMKLACLWILNDISIILPYLSRYAMYVGLYYWIKCCIVLMWTHWKSIFSGIDTRTQTYYVAVQSRFRRRDRQNCVSSCSRKKLKNTTHTWTKRFLLFLKYLHKDFYRSKKLFSLK